MLKYNICVVRTNNGINFLVLNHELYVNYLYGSLAPRAVIN